MDSTIWSTGVSILVIMETLGSRALVPILSATAKPVVRRNSTTSITEEHMTRRTTNNIPTPMARIRGRSLGMRSLPSANRAPKSCIRSWSAGSSSSMISSPCFMTYWSGR